MTTIADFKREMIVGSKWHGTHCYTDNNPTPPKDFGVRKCGLSNTVGFAFVKENGKLSHCSWPTKDTFSAKENVVTIDTGFCVLTYTKIVEEKGEECDDTK